MRLPATIQHPARIVPIAFVLLTLIGTLVLLLPAATSDGHRAPLLTALFTATSAVTVTGLVVVETGTYWSGTGQAIIIGLCQVGGVGIMAAGTLLALGISRRLGLRMRLVAAAETGAFGIGELRSVLRSIALTVITCEAVLVLILTIRLLFVYDNPLTALWQGIFQGISAFTNAGFVIWPGGTAAFSNDYVVLLTIGVGVVVGSLGFPVMRELWQEFRRPQTWTVHTRLTVWGTVLLLLGGFLLILLFEWSNPETLGQFDDGGKVMHAFFASTQPRSGGFSAIDTGQVNHETSLALDALMFIGGGSAGVAGGIKITTFMLLIFVIWAEVRGERDVVVGGRRISAETTRLAVSIALLGVAAIFVGTLVLVATTPLPIDKVMFEAISAFGTVGLSSGITSQLPESGQLVLVALMLIGRVGTVTAASAFALASRSRLYRLPEERPIVG